MRTLTTPIAQLVVHQDGGRHSINSRATMLEGYVPFAGGFVDRGSDPSGRDAGSSGHDADSPGCDAGSSGHDVGPSGRDAGSSGRDATLSGCEAHAASSGISEIPSEKAMRAAMAGVRIVSLASLFRAPLDRPEVIRSLVRAAKEAGAIVCADTKLPTYREVPPEELADVWPLIDFIFPNEKEAAYYTGETGYAEMAAAFRRLGVRNVIIKAGPEGCFVDGEGICFSNPQAADGKSGPRRAPSQGIRKKNEGLESRELKEGGPRGGRTDIRDENEGSSLRELGKPCIRGGRPEGMQEEKTEGGTFHLPALPVEVVDSTGAGDNFVAGFLSGILQGEGLRTCAERGRVRASACISRMGGGS